MKFRMQQSFQNGEWIVIDKSKTLNLNSYKDENSAVSSSDSCSINSYNRSVCFEDVEVRDSDAESVCEMIYDEEEEESDDDYNDECFSLGDEIHRLELHAYQCTMEAFHASGPLTWEKETMGQSTGLNTFGFCINAGTIFGSYVILKYGKDFLACEFFLSVKSLQSANHICIHLQKKMWTKRLQSARRILSVF